MTQESMWMDLADALAVHDMELAARAGSEGVRDQGLLESAVARARNIWAYAGEPTCYSVLAAAYASEISSNHPFMDGNRRTALVVSFAFLGINGIEVSASQEDAYLTFLGLAEGEISEAQLSQWFRSNTTPC